MDGAEPERIVAEITNFIDGVIRLLENVMFYFNVLLSYSIVFQFQLHVRSRPHVSGFF